MSNNSNILLQDITFSYQPDRPIIFDLSLCIPSGFSLLVGPTGCGKSTLLKIIAGLYPSFAGKLSGSVHLNGQKAAMMFQNSSEQFTMKTPYEEIIFALENLQITEQIAQKRLDKACDFTQIKQFLHEPITNLSGGEKQRVALAVLIAMDIDIFLLDEPFASCDPENRKFLINKLASLKSSGKTIIISDHQLTNYQSVCDRIYQFNSKNIKLLSRKSMDTLFANTNYNLQTIKFELPQTSELSIFSLKNTKISSNRLLLSQNNLEIPCENIMLFGPNGSGKTSFFKVLTKMMPYSGEIKFKKNEIKKLNARKYLQHVAQIFQDANDQFLSIKMCDEIDLSKKNRNAYFNDQIIKQALKDLDLDSHLNQSIYTLSGGQKKKLQILLMLICQHEVLLIDEPLAGLDHKSIKQVCNLLSTAQNEVHKSFIFISHQISPLSSLCKYCLKFDQQKLTYISEVKE